MVPSCTKTDSTDPTPVVKDPYAMFKYTKKDNGIVSFTNTSTDATSYLWNFGDGETSTTAAVTFEHQYLQNGTYKATLTAYGNGKSTGAYADLNITSVVGETITDIAAACEWTAAFDGWYPPVILATRGLLLIAKHGLEGLSHFVTSAIHLVIDDKQGLTQVDTFI